MRCLERFNRKMEINGGSIRSENIISTRKLVESCFEDDASFKKGVYRWELNKTDYSKSKPIKVRFYKESFSNANGVQTKFQTLFNEPIDVGDILYDSKRDCYWICTESFYVGEVNYQGKFTLCNWILKWQDKDGKILNYPCYDINSTQYNSGEKSNKVFTIGSSQHMITLPCDENTVVLNSPKRFYLDKNTINPTSFVVTQNDTTSYAFGKKGLVKVTVKECANNDETDRPDLGICDYFDPVEIETDNSNGAYISKSVIYYDTDVIKSGGDIQKFSAKFFDNNGNEVLDVVPKWSVICDFADELFVNENNGNIYVGIDNDNYIDEKVKLVVSDSFGNYSSYIILNVESLL